MPRFFFSVSKVGMENLTSPHIDVIVLRKQIVARQWNVDGVVYKAPMLILLEWAMKNRDQMQSNGFCINVAASIVSMKTNAWA
jgi:hypothetical protein